MSVDVHVLFQSDASLEGTIDALQRLLHVQFKRIVDDDLIRYEFIGPGFMLAAFGDADFESTVDGHHLADYPFAIDCWATEPHLDYEAAESIRMGISRFIFRKVVGAGHRALLVYDLQRVVEASS